MTKTKQEARKIRRYRVRAKVSGTQSQPRLSIYRSNKHIYAQVINDEKANTILALSTKDLKIKNGSNKEAATKLGIELAKKIKTKKINSIVFDRGGYKYHGRVKALADACRAEGIKF